MEINIDIKDSYYIASIDAADCKTLKEFLQHVRSAFKFPEYYGQNYDAFLDCINDLAWLNKENYLLIINNSDLLLCDEQDKGELVELKNEFLEITNNWKLGPEAEGDDSERKVSVFKVLYN